MSHIEDHMEEWEERLANATCDEEFDSIMNDIQEGGDDLPCMEV
jgi:hypothetical protein